jgi:hypothetical protein
LMCEIIYMKNYRTGKNKNILNIQIVIFYISPMSGKYH